MIVDHYMTEHLDISRRVHDNYHRVENDDLMKNIFNSGKNKEGARMKIPDWMMIEEMKQTNHYHMYATIFRVNVPTTQSQHIESTQGTHRPTSAPKTFSPEVTDKESSAQFKEHMVDEELDQLLEGTENVDVDAFMDDVLNSQKDPGTRIEPRSDKESLKGEKDADMVNVTNDDEEEESVGDEFELKRREKGKGIEETKDTPPPIPVRSPRTHIDPLSSDKETL
ncbi:hypothetical protein Tco_1293436 [Tanacetum coccineum]